MRIQQFILLIICTSLVFSCSNDDENTIPHSNNNGFTVGDSFFAGNFVYLNDENIVNNNPSDLAIILSDTFLLEDNIDGGINYMYVDYSGIDFEIGEKVLLDYRITENASRVNGWIEGGNKLLDNASNTGLTATQINFTVNSITDNTINFDFSFTREDGEIIEGQYSGEYTNVSE